MLTWTRRGSNPGLHGERLATNRLSHCTAFYDRFVLLQLCRNTKIIHLSCGAVNSCKHNRRFWGTCRFHNLRYYLPDYTASHPRLEFFAVIALRTSKSQGVQIFSARSHFRNTQGGGLTPTLGTIAHFVQFHIFSEQNEIFRNANLFCFKYV